MKGKIVLITGSGIGIGKATALQFAKEKCSLIITYNKDREETNNVLKECLKIGAPEAIALELNLMESKSIKECVKKAVAKFKKIDILVNNAGVIAWKHFSKQTEDEIEAQIRVNYEGLVKMTKECLPYVKETIINIASGAGKTPYAGLSVYCGTKFAVRGFTQALAQELKEIRVYAVNPSMTATRMTKFMGMPTEKVAEVIVKAAKGGYGKKSGEDIDVWEYV